MLFQLARPLPCAFGPWVKRNLAQGSLRISFGKITDEADVASFVEGVQGSGIVTDLITLHTHSTFCGHAKDSLSAMVDAASRRCARDGCDRALSGEPTLRPVQAREHAHRAARAVLPGRLRRARPASRNGNLARLRARLAWQGRGQDSSARISIASTSFWARCISLMAGSSTAPARRSVGVRWASTTYGGATSICGATPQRARCRSRSCRIPTW